MAIRVRSPRRCVYACIPPCRVPLDIVSLLQRLTLVFAPLGIFLSSSCILTSRSASLLVFTRLSPYPLRLPPSDSSLQSVIAEFTIIGLPSKYSLHSCPFVRYRRVHPFFLAPLNIMNIYPSPQSSAFLFFYIDLLPFRSTVGESGLP